MLSFSTREDRAMKTRLRTMLMTVAAVAAAAPAVWMLSDAKAQPQARQVPKFEADPSWPKLPAKWIFGQVSSVSIDENGHAWVLQRPSTVRADQKAKRQAAPPGVEFDGD